MKTVRRTSQFKRDVKRIEGQRRELESKTVRETLGNGEPLAAKHRDHILVGHYKGT